MPRPPRTQLPGVPLHVVQRGNDRNRTFFRQHDYRAYLNFLVHGCELYATALHAYVLMTNHVHLLLTPSEPGGVSKTMQLISSTYSRYVNANHDRTGTLWEGRFRSSPVDSDRYLLACYRYIEMNPVRAGLVKHPIDYRWSSYAENVGERTPVIVEEHPSFTALAQSRTERIDRYRELVRQQLSENTLEAIRYSARRGKAFGSERFSRDLARRRETDRGV